MLKSKDKIIIQILCVVAALATWLFVVNEVNPITGKDVASIPIIIRNADALEELGLVVAGIDISEIRVTVEGYRNDILNITRNDINAFIDVKGYKEGLNKMPVELELPDGVNIVDYSPKQILCELEAVVNRTIDLSVEIDGLVEDGYYVGRSISSVNSVIIRGPRSVVNSAVKAVALFNVNEATDSLEKRIPIDVYSDKGLELDVRITPEIAEITVPIYPTKRVEFSVPIAITPRDGYEVTTITVEPRDILVAAEPNVLANMVHVLTEAVDYEDVTSNIYVTVDIVAGNFILVENVTPVVTINIERITSKILIFNLSEIEFVNIPEGYTIAFTAEDQPIQVEVTGLSSFIDALVKEDIKLKADVGMLEGEVGLIPIYYESGKTFRDITIEFENVEVMLTAIQPATEPTTENTQPTN
ncbi:MAG: CdaR family protein [Eubacteriales bacterium]|nr:CdaR family protein [Eubacteriales bacterium]